MEAEVILCHNTEEEFSTAELSSIPREIFLAINFIPRADGRREAYCAVVALGWLKGGHQINILNNGACGRLSYFEVNMERKAVESDVRIKWK